MEENTINKQNEVKEEKKSTLIEDVYDLIQVFIQAIIIIALIFIFIFRIAGVSGNSMYPTLHNKDWLVLSNINYEAKRGDIVVCSQPNAFNEPLIKRIIAVGGETVNIKENGDITINGEIIDEPYIAEVTKVMGDGGVTFPHTVPDGYYFVMGDNRNYSSDSRFSTVGDIDGRYIVGEAKMRLLPIGNNKIAYNGIEYDIDKD